MASPYKLKVTLTIDCQSEEEAEMLSGRMQLLGFALYADGFRNVMRGELLTHKAVVAAEGAAPPTPDRSAN